MHLKYKSRIAIEEFLGDFSTAARWLNDNGRADQLLHMVTGEDGRTLLVLHVVEGVEVAE